MRISELKQQLRGTTAVTFRMADGTPVPAHFHITEIGLVTKHFIDCGGTERKETIASLQLWVAGDYDHRLSPEKFLHILELSHRILGDEDLEIEAEYQQQTIGRFGLDYDGHDFILLPKYTACLAQDNCGIPAKKKISLSELPAQPACCTPGEGCC